MNAVQEIGMVALDAVGMLEVDEARLQQLIPQSRAVTPDSFLRLRLLCMEFLHTCTHWDAFM